LESVGISNSHHQLPDADGVGVAETGRHQMRRVNAHHRDIGIRVVTDQISRLTAAIRQRHDELGGAMHDMAVGQNKAVGCKEKSRAIPTHVWCQAWIRARCAATLVLYLNIHHGRAHLFRSVYYSL
jgi:hypothetical protein